MTTFENGRGNRCRSHDGRRQAFSAAKPSGTIGTPAIRATMMAPGLQYRRGPFDPSSVMHGDCRSSRIVALSRLSAAAPLLRAEPLTALLPKSRQYLDAELSVDRRADEKGQTVPAGYELRHVPAQDQQAFVPEGKHHRLFFGHQFQEPFVALDLESKNSPDRLQKQYEDGRENSQDQPPKGSDLPLRMGVVSDVVFVSFISTVGSLDSVHASTR